MKKAVLLIGFLVLVVALSGCTESDGSYSCRYESRHTGCGGSDWTSWETECFAFNMDDYKDDWTPEKVCGDYSGSDTHCNQSCCIYTEYRNNALSAGGC